MDVVPIRVQIGLRANGQADHPDWTQVDIGNDPSGRLTPEAHMLGGWIYDKSSGHKEASPDSPYGVQYGVLLVTPFFARQAMRKFPNLISEITEPELENFFDNKSRAHMQMSKYDTMSMEGLKLEFDLRTAASLDTAEITARIVNAVDPDNQEPGISTNKERLWSSYKANLDANIVPSASP